MPDVWAKPQKILEVTPFKNILPGDEQSMKTADEFLNAEQVEIYFEPNDETDYAIHNSDGSVTRVSHCVNINGVSWFVTPGRSKVPKPVYEFLKQCPEQRRLMPGPQPGKSSHLGLMR